MSSTVTRRVAARAKVGRKRRPWNDADLQMNSRLTEDGSPFCTSGRARRPAEPSPHLLPLLYILMGMRYPIRQSKTVELCLVFPSTSRYETILMTGQRKTMKAARLERIGMARLLSLLLMALPAAAQAQYSYITNSDNTITITDYTGSAAKVTITNRIDGLLVTSIGNSAFSGCTGVTGVTLPDSITNIGNYAFYNTTLGTVTIPRNVISVGNAAFSGPSITKILVDASNPAYSSVSGVLFNKNQTTLVEFPSGKAASYAIPNGVTSIGLGAFADCYKLSAVTIPITVTNIGDNAFYGSALSAVTIPVSVTSIGSNAFYGVNMKTIAVNANNSVYSGVGGVLFNKNQTTLIEYPAAKSGSYTVPGGVTSIGDGAFKYCTKLTSVAIPNSMTSIGEDAFKYCVAMTVATLGNSVTNIGHDAFYNCSLLASVTIPGSMTSIGDGAFSYCAKLAGVTIANGVTNIGYAAFADCGSLTNIVIPASVTSMGDAVFADCTNLVSVTIPESVDNVGSYEFYHCLKLGSFTIGSSVTNIGTLAFYACGKLKRLDIPDTVTSIGDYAFMNCTNLNSLTLGDGVTNIGIQAFAQCISLVNITIPEGVTSIGSGVFYQCLSLAGLYFKGDAPIISPNSFSGDSNTTVYYLPGTGGWGATLGELPAVLWNPAVQNDASFGLRLDRFGFNIGGTSNIIVVVEACTDLVNSGWVLVSTNTVTNGATYFGDTQQWTNHPNCYYRLRMP
jgi:hypothetical protein